MINPDFIPGIYNYCDKWCDRCEFRMRCSIYVDEEKIEMEEQMSNEVLIGVISEKLKGLSELFEQHDALMQFTQDNIMETLISIEVSDDAEVMNHLISHQPLIVKSKDYGRSVNGWLQLRMLDTHVKKLHDDLRGSVLSEREVNAELDLLQDCVDDIIRFLAFIPVKLKRAINSARTLKKWENDNGLQNDSDGSAKIALIGIDRSIHAWSTIMSTVSELEDDCLKYLIKLTQLKELTIKEFPNAMEFVRPGFDQKTKITNQV